MNLNSSTHFCSSDSPKDSIRRERKGGGGEEGGEKRGEKKEKKKRKEEKKRRLHELSFQGISEDNIKINAQTGFNIAFSSIDSKQQSIEDAEGDLLEKTHETTAAST